MFWGWFLRSDVCRGVLWGADFVFLFLYVLVVGWLIGLMFWGYAVVMGISRSAAFLFFLFPCFCDRASLVSDNHIRSVFDHVG